jgi:hypothetical protein
MKRKLLDVLTYNKVFGITKQDVEVDLSRMKIQYPFKVKETKRKVKAYIYEKH